MIYEHIKKMVKGGKEQLNPLDYIMAAGAAKFTASSLCYPHGKMFQHTTMAFFTTYISLHRGGEDQTATESLTR